MGIHNKLGQKIKGDKVPFESIKNVFPNKETIIAGIDVSVFLYQSIKTAYNNNSNLWVVTITIIGTSHSKQIISPTK